MSVQPLQLIVYHSPLFAAHWAFFLPNSTDPKIGTRIHADGSPATGFEVNFELEYDLRECTQSYQIINLGEARKEDIERVAKAVPAPAKSLVAASESAPKRRIEIRNCQTWIRDVVQKLVEAGVVGDNAVLEINNAPMK